MKVMKFGGTSVGTPQRMKEVAQLVTKSGEPVFVVLSAMSGTTNSLVEISDYLYKKNPDGANEVINNLERKYERHIQELYATEEIRTTTREFLREEFNYLRSFTKELFTSFEEKSIVAQGEIISTNMMVNYMKEQGINAVLLNALDFMRTDKNAEPDPVYIKEKLAAVMKASEEEAPQVYVTQGFIAGTTDGRRTTLGREGSDYTAALLANLLDAKSVTLWKDVPGVMSADPLQDSNARLLPNLTYEETEQILSHGAQIIHPKTIAPLKEKKIPLYVKPFLHPEEGGTEIRN